MPDVIVNGTALETTDCGEGRAVLLVHGSGSDHRTWEAQRERWCESYRLVTYSRRYHWPNDPIEEGGTYALEDHVSDLGALIGRLRLAPVALIGHSYGGLVSLLTAARRPELVDGLVLIEPPVMGLFGESPPTVSGLLKLATRRPRTALGLFKLGARAFGPAQAAFQRGDEDEALRLLGEGIVGVEAFAALSDERRRQVRDNTTLEELTSREAMPRLHEDAITAIPCPVLLVGGEASPPIFHRLMDALEDLLDDVERVRVPDASHLVHEDNPEGFGQVVESFLRRTTEAARMNGAAGA